jgi:hypothetical protein
VITRTRYCPASTSRVVVADSDGPCANEARTARPLDVVKSAMYGQGGPAKSMATSYVPATITNTAELSAPLPDTAKGAIEGRVVGGAAGDCDGSEAVATGVAVICSPGAVQPATKRARTNIEGTLMNLWKISAPKT